MKLSIPNPHTAAVRDPPGPVNASLPFLPPLNLTVVPSSPPTQILMQRVVSLLPGASVSYLQVEFLISPSVSTLLQSEEELEAEFARDESLPLMGIVIYNTTGRLE